MDSATDGDASGGACASAASEPANGHPAPTVGAEDTDTAFVLAATRIAAVPFLPELRLHIADEALALWQQLERTLARGEAPLPFWAFPWAGGQALARYLLDHPEVVRGRTVLDVGSGSGLVALAAARAGAARVVANDLDPHALAAIEINAALNAINLDRDARDLLDTDGGACEVVLIGDLCYEAPLAQRVLGFVQRARARGATVLLGDPGRPHLPRAHLEPVATYDISAAPGIEDAEVKRTTVW